MAKKSPVKFPYKDPKKEVNKQAVLQNHLGSVVNPDRKDQQIMHIPLWTGIAFRILFLVCFPSVSRVFGERIEVSTPVTSFKRLQEGLYLFRHGLSPYDGGIYHQVYVSLF